MKPSAGRIVLYVAPEGMTRPALIIGPCTEIFPGSAYTREECQLHVFFDGTNDWPFDHSGNRIALDPWRTSVPHDEDKKPGTWHWLGSPFPEVG